MDNVKWFEKVWDGLHQVSHRDTFLQQTPEFKDKFMTAAIPFVMTTGRERLDF